MMKLLYFTSTGNCLYVAKSIGGEPVSIPQAIKQNRFNFSDSKIGFILPVYWITIPLPVEEFMRKIRIDSKYIFAVLTYGMLAGTASAHLHKIGKECGIEFSYINTLKMVDNYLPNFDMNKQIESEPKKRIDDHMNAIIGDINNSKTRLPHSSFIDNWLIGMMRNRELVGAGVAKDYHVEDSCNGCETCVKVCPMGNVTMQANKPVFGTRCMTCLACTHNCPKNSIRIKVEKSRARFRNQHIMLKEIIDSNKQF